MKKITTLAVGFALAAAGSAATAQDLGALKEAAGGLDVGSLVSDNAGNVAGIVQFCLKNKYLGGSDAGSIQQRLTSKFGLGGLAGDADAADGAAAVEDAATSGEPVATSLEDKVKAAASDALAGSTPQAASDEAATPEPATPEAVAPEAMTEEVATQEAVAQETAGEAATPSEADKAGFLDGAKGLLKLKDGKSMNLADNSGGLKQKLTEKACDAILDQAKSLL